MKVSTSYAILELLVIKGIMHKMKTNKKNIMVIINWKIIIIKTTLKIERDM